MSTRQRQAQSPRRAEAIGSVPEQAQLIGGVLKQGALRRQQQDQGSAWQACERFRALVGAEALARGCPPGRRQRQGLTQPATATIETEQLSGPISAATLLAHDPGVGTIKHQAFAIPFYTVRERLERLDEAVQVIKLLWTQPRPTFQGRYYQLDEPPYNPPNIQQPHPPILVGGGGEKHTLRTVARYADAANVSGTPEDVRHKYDVLEHHCREAGRDYSSIRRTIQVPLFLSDDPAFQQRVVQGVVSYRGGSEEDARRSVLMGSVDDVKAGVQAFADAGVQEIIVAQFPRFHRDSLLRFSREVIPAFR